jgi:uroporphyrinogen-III synthase
LRSLLLLRPEPGLSTSAERARAMGLEVIECPLFRVEPIDWQAPDPGIYDALLLTSANAVRMAGPELAKLQRLPAHAVGAATAEAALATGLEVETLGTGNATELMSALPRSLKLLHLAGEDHVHVGDWPIDHVIVYRAAALEEPDLPAMSGLVAAVHSPRAGRRLAELVAGRSQTAIAAISPAAAEACGGGWERVEAATAPNDQSLLALAARLCHTEQQ